MTTITPISHDRTDGRVRAAAASSDRLRDRIAADAVVSTYINDLAGPRPETVVRAARELDRPRLIARQRGRRRRLEPACAIAGA